ncbi:MAG: response regulator, partial [Myxococcota bacterium]
MSKARVAIIDDQERMRDILGMVLERAGHIVSRFSAGESFLDVLSAGERFDVVVTDLKMPGMTGLEV